MKSLILVFGILIAGHSNAADTGINASSTKLKIYTIAVSENADCSDPIIVMNNDAGEWFDFVANPEIGNPNVAPGTYKCIVWRMSDIVKITPAETSTSGNCQAGVSFSLDVCGTGSSVTPLIVPADRTDKIGSYGVAFSCTSSTADANAEIVTLFLSTQAAYFQNGDSFNLPTIDGSGNGIRIASPFIVNGTKKVKLIFNTAGLVMDASGSCQMNQPIFGFEDVSADDGSQ